VVPLGVKATSPDTRFYLDQYDVSGFLNAGNVGWDPELIEHGNFLTEAGLVTASGKYGQNASETMYFDGVDNQIDEIMDLVATTNANNPHYRGRAFGSHAEGYPIYETIEKLTGKPIVAASGQMLMLNGAWSGAGPSSRSLILRNATVTGTGSSTGRNQGVTSATQTYQAVLRVLGGTFTSITLQIHQSSDNGVGDAYSLITGMTHTFTAVGVRRVTFTGVTEAWKRLTISAFSGTNAIIVVTGGNVKGIEP
jgi:hypothetical protein